MYSMRKCKKYIHCKFSLKTFNAALKCSGLGALPPLQWHRLDKLSAVIVF